MHIVKIISRDSELSCVRVSSVSRASSIHLHSTFDKPIQSLWYLKILFSDYIFFPTSARNHFILILYKPIESPEINYVSGFCSGDSFQVQLWADNFICDFKFSSELMTWVIYVPEARFLNSAMRIFTGHLCVSFVSLLLHFHDFDCLNHPLFFGRKSTFLHLCSVNFRNYSRWVFPLLTSV